LQLTLVASFVLITLLSYYDFSAENYEVENYTWFSEVRGVSHKNRLSMPRVILTFLVLANTVTRISSLRGYQ